MRHKTGTLQEQEKWVEVVVMEGGGSVCVWGVRWGKDVLFKCQAVQMFTFNNSDLNISF